MGAEVLPAFLTRMVLLPSDQPITLAERCSSTDNVALCCLLPINTEDCEPLKGALSREWAKKMELKVWDSLISGCPFLIHYCADNKCGSITNCCSSKMNEAYELLSMNCVE